MTMRGIGQVDPELAIQIMENHPHPMHYGESLEGIADGLRQTDPARAVEFTRQFGANFRQHMADWGKRDPGGSLAWSAKNEVGDGLSAGARLALDVIAREHPERIGESLRQLQRLAASLAGVTAENRAEAMALLDPDSGLAADTRQALAGAIAGGWLGEDREAAERWVAGLEDEKMREAGLARLNKPEETGAEPPPPAGELVRRLGSEEVARGGNPFLSQIGNWTASDLAEARASFREMPSEARDRAAALMIDQQNWQVAAPIRSEALGHLIATGSTGPLSERDFMSRVSETAARWGRADPAAAADWVTSLPPGLAHEWAGRNVAQEWARHSEQEARGWIEGLDHAEERAVLLGVLAAEE